MTHALTKVSFPNGWWDELPCLVLINFVFFFPPFIPIFQFVSFATQKFRCIHCTRDWNGMKLYNKDLNYFPIQIKYVLCLFISLFLFGNSRKSMFKKSKITFYEFCCCSILCFTKFLKTFSSLKNLNKESWNFGSDNIICTYK